MYLPSGSFLINIGLSEVWKKNKEKTTLSSLLVQLMPGVRIQQHTLIHAVVSFNPSMVHPWWFFCKTLYQKKEKDTFVWPWKMVSESVRYFFYQPMDGKIKTWTVRFPAKENPNMEKALFDWLNVLHYDVKPKYRLISRKFSGVNSFHPTVRLTNQKPRTFCIRSTNQSNRSISVRLLLLCCSRVFISRSYENRSI